jgi:hypothetical protein
MRAGSAKEGEAISCFCIYLSSLPFYVIPAPIFMRVNCSRNPSSLLEILVRLPAKAGKATSPHK